LRLSTPQGKVRIARLLLIWPLTHRAEEYATLRDQWIREGEGFILVYSIASRRSYDRIKTFQDSIMRVKRGARPVFMLVGNKHDKGPEREVSREEAQALSAYLGLDLAPG
jgi:GTPase KRas protein